jgi:hypothetical protein
MPTVLVSPAAGPENFASVIWFYSAIDNEQEERITMQQTSLRGLMKRGLAAYSLFTFLAVVPIFGQTGRSLKAEVPYEFIIGSKVLPAGTYTFVLPAGRAWLDVRSTTGVELRAPILTRLGGPTDFQDGSFVFDRAGSKYTLSEVWMPGTDGILLHSTPKGHTHEMLLISGLNPNVSLSGRTAYDRTCRRCHGQDGKGDDRADKFFNIAIPRLVSADVQRKSDAELREIITKGRRAMDPVKIDEAGFRHRLPPQSVDAVIAHVRTFKQ